jgi:hypothetical protein
MVVASVRAVETDVFMLCIGHPHGISPRSTGSKEGPEIAAATVAFGGG